MAQLATRWLRSPCVAGLLLANIALSPAALAQGLCKPAIAQAERGSGVPDRLLQAVAIIESGRRDATGTVAAWPWTINVEGVGEVFDTKAQAIAAVLAHQARGARSIDVGCTQINLMHHPTAFASLDEAFDPAANARYAAAFLQRLLAQTGSWPRAVAGYHSLTPDIGGEYARKVLAVWALPEGTRSAASPPPGGAALPGAAPAVPSSQPPPALSAGTAGGRMMVTTSGHGPSMTGRSLDSYRAIPNRSLGLTRF